MPRLTRLYIKTALIYLLIALALGVLLLIGQPSQISLALRDLQIVYSHLFMVGWVTQLIFGISWWMFPILAPDRPRGDERLSWFVYGALNVGLLLRAVAEPLHSFNLSAIWVALLIVSAVLQVAAACVYVVQLWPRVKGPKQDRWAGK